MKRSSGLWLRVTGVGCLVFAAACSQTGPGGTTSGSGGSQGSGSGGNSSSSGGITGSGGDNSASGGNTGSGGSSASGGTTGSGGNTASGGTTGSGGNPASGGTTGSGGNTASGGTTGSGGNTSSGGTTGSGGNPASGGTTGSGGKPASGGTTGSGGNSSGGTTGSGGAAGSGAITAASLVPGLVNLYWEGTCVGTRDPGGHNCPLDDNGSNCPSNSDPTMVGTVRSKTIPVMGTKNQAYTVNIEVMGVIGTRCYSGGTRQSTAAIMTDGYNNSWYVGGSPSNATDWWNSYELHVAPSTGDPSGDVYYFNSFDNSGGSYCDSEATYMVHYTAHFKVLGGGTLTLKLHDYNCQAQQNCGSNTDGTSTCMPRTVTFGSFNNTVMNSFLAGSQTKATGTLAQPPTDNLSKTYNPQWMMIDVTSVTSP
ncbi:MAG TPA: hypothetical protein VGP07_15100 [Polyangia bacterium]|jgi:hypothetical protein